MYDVSANSEVQAGSSRCGKDEMEMEEARRSAGKYVVRVGFGEFGMAESAPPFEIELRR